MERIITERCRGLYKTTPNSRVQQCEHPISHLADCGPDTIARPYESPAAPVYAPLLPRVMDYCFVANSGSWGDRRVHPVVAAALLAFATMLDARQGEPVAPKEVAAVLGNAASTVRTHLRSCDLIAQYAKGVDAYRCA